MNAEETRHEQDEFDFTIGQLDRCLSRLILWAENPLLPDFNKQTLKHHAEDMDGASTKILNLVTHKKAPGSKVVSSPATSLKLRSELVDED